MSRSSRAAANVSLTHLKKKAKKSNPLLNDGLHLYAHNNLPLGLFYLFFILR